MKKFKVQLHTHTKSDPCDWIFHTEKELIDRAARHQYDVLAITCHDKIVFSEEIRRYADKKHILLIPGIERSILGRHVVVINPSEEILAVHNFDQLRSYKKNNSRSLIIAPHPFHPMRYSLLEHFEKNADIFDAVEWSSFYTPLLKFNKKALKAAENHKLPLIGTSDNHVLKYLDLTYSYVFSPEKSTESIINSIKKGHIKIKTKPMSFIKLFLMTAKLNAFSQARKGYRSIAKKIKS